jgi:hypothetical protein
VPVMLVTRLFVGYAPKQSGGKVGTARMVDEAIPLIAAAAALLCVLAFVADASKP